MLTAIFPKGRGGEPGDWGLEANDTLKIILTLVYFELIRSRWTQIIAQGPNVTKTMAVALTLMLKCRGDPSQDVFLLNP